MQKDVLSIEQWTQLNGIRLYIGKSCAMFIGTQNHMSTIYKNSPVPLAVAAGTMRYVKRAKSFGLIINPTLTSREFFNAFIASLDYFAITRVFLDYKRFTLHMHPVESAVFPIFDYVAVVYHTVTATEETKLQQSLNACVHFVSGKISRIAHVTPYRLSLGWLSSQHRRDPLLDTFIFVTVTGNMPCSLFDRLTLGSKTSLRSTLVGHA